MRDRASVVERAVAAGDDVYGVTTGVASRKRVTRLEDDGRLQPAAPREPSHRPGPGRAGGRRPCGGAADRERIRAGVTGVRPELAERLVAALNDGEVTPAVRMLGSVGQSDLAPNADLASALFDDFELARRRGALLVNNNAFSTGLAALAVADCATLLDALDVAGALDLEAFAANLSIIHPEVARHAALAGVVDAAVDRLHRAPRRQLPVGAGAARNLQDPLTFRGCRRCWALRSTRSTTRRRSRSS